MQRDYFSPKRNPFLGQIASCSGGYCFEYSAIVLYSLHFVSKSQHFSSILKARRARENRGSTGRLIRETRKTRGGLEEPCVSRSEKGYIISFFEIATPASPFMNAALTELFRSGREDSQQGYCPQGDPPLHSGSRERSEP